MSAAPRVFVCRVIDHVSDLLVDARGSVARGDAIPCGKYRTVAVEAHSAVEALHAAGAFGVVVSIMPDRRTGQRAIVGITRRDEAAQAALRG